MPEAGGGPAPGEIGRLLHRIAWLAVLVCSLAVCIDRGPMRRVRAYDFAAPYVASRQLWTLSNPYGHYDFRKTWAQAGARNPQAADESGIRPVYPLSTLVLLLPISWMSWGTAEAIVIWGGFACYLLLLWRLSGFVSPAWDSRRAAFLCLGLLLSPAQTCFFTVNLTMEAFLCCAFGIILAAGQSPVPGALLILLGCALKPTTGLAFVLVLLLLRVWRALAAFAVSGLVLAAACAWIAHMLPPLWIKDYQANIAYLFGAKGVGSFTTANPMSWQLVNLQLPLYATVHHTLAANGLAWALGAGLFAWWTARYWRTGADWLKVTAPAALISLLPVYQRNYNLVLVLFALMLLCREGPRAPRSLWLLAAVCIVPLQALMRAHIPGHIEFSPVGKVLLVPIVTWAVLAAAVQLLARPSQRAAG